MTYWAYWSSRFLLWVIFRLGYGLEVTGQSYVPKRGACILACNHTSFLDPPVLGVACPRRVVFMARADLFQYGLLAMYMRSVGVIPVARGEADLPAVRATLDRLRRGEVVGIFPEGGRQRTGQLGHAKRGVGVLAVTAKASIVPVVIHGTFQALPPDARGPRRAKIRVAFGPPIAYTDSAFVSPVSAPTRLGAGQEPEQAPRHQHQALADAVTSAWQRLDAQLNRSPSCRLPA